MDLLNFDIDKSTKIYFSIGEVAKMLDVNTSLVRFWEKEFEILKPKKNKKGNRQFTKEDVKNCHLIYHLVLWIIRFFRKFLTLLNLHFYFFTNFF